MSAPGRHILMIVDAVGSVWTYATRLARKLCAHDHSVTLVTMATPPHRGGRTGRRAERTRTIAEAARKRILAQHTYVRRATEIEAIFNELTAQAEAAA